MTTLKTVSTFQKIGGGDVIADLYKSISFLQTTYCFPPESEFYTVANLISPDLDYVEFIIEYHDAESYNRWYELFGEIVEELVVEFRKELSDMGIVYQRYLPTEMPFFPEDALPLESLASKFEIVNGETVYKKED